MNYNSTFWPFWTKLWQEARKNYLDFAHTKEEEVRKLRGRHLFYLDGCVIYIPEELVSVRYYRKWYLKQLDNIRQI
jgi:hypothetical protein